MKKLESRCKTLNKSKRGTAFILSAPAGTGKTTLISRLTHEFDHLVRSISFTTRRPRNNEKEGHDYHFVSFQEFKHKIDQGHFIEYAEVFGNFYGTDKTSIDKLLEQGFDVVLVIDTQGALAIKPFFPGVYIFMGPPSMEELSRRLRNRETENDGDIQVRLEWAKHEIEQASKYDYQIINGDLEETYQTLKSIIIAEHHKT